MAKKKKAVKKAAVKPAKKTKKVAKSTPKRKVVRRSSAPPAPPAPITHEMVAKRAYEIWLRKSRGVHSNNSVQNWLEAEAELRGGAKK
jgi:hypothetical protein